MRQNYVNTAVLAGLVLSLLSACGGGGAVSPGPLPEKKLLHADNYLDAAGVAVLGYMRSQSLPSQVVAPGWQLLLSQKADGQYPCELAGTLQLTRTAGLSSFKAERCQTSAIELQSGSYEIAALNGMSYTFKDLNLLLNGDNQLQKFNGILRSEVVGQLATTSGSLSVERNQKTDRYTDYKISAPAVGPGDTSISMNIDSPRFAHSLSFSASQTETLLNATIVAKDNSVINLVLAKDNSLKLELREVAAAAVVQTRQLSASETAALIKKLSE